MADMTRKLCLLLLALAGPAAALDGSDSCSVAARGGVSLPSSDVDYAALNRALLTSDANQRLIALSSELKRLDLARAPESGLVRQRLLVALARTQAELGMNVAAMGNLKRLPVNSPAAPEALMLMADIEVKNGKPRAAVRWLRHLADLYPEETLTIQALWRAAELNHPHSRQALALWQEAARQADEALAAAQTWHERSQKPDFVETVSGARLSPELWRLARTTLIDPAFASAEHQLQCGTASQGGSLQRMESSRALAGANGTGGSSRTRVQALLQQRLEAAVKDWEQLSAEAHYRLADAQEPRIHPGLTPRD